ncbi:MAG TPA: hypothetical protein VF780_07935 [Nitrosospira sp.]
MHKGIAVLLTGIVIGYGSVAMARDGGGGHNGHGNAGGMASGHMSQEGKENTNAQWSSGAAKGDERSDSRNDRDRGNGQDHGKGKGHGHGHEKHKGKGGSGGGSN